MNNSIGSIAVVSLMTLPLGLAAFADSARAQASERHHTVVHADSIQWGPAPPSLPPGAQAAVLLGSPAKEGPFVLRLRFPAGFVVPPHRHSKDEFLTVIAGKFAVAHGEKLDRAAIRPLPSGSFVHLPAGMPHYAFAHEEAIVQINGIGPFDVVYIDPKDDPEEIADTSADHNANQKLRVFSDPDRIGVSDTKRACGNRNARALMEVGDGRNATQLEIK